MAKPPFAFDAVGKPVSIFAKGGFLLSKDFYFTGIAGGFFAKSKQGKRLEIV